MPVSVPKHKRAVMGFTEERWAPDKLASLIAQLVKNLPAMQETSVQFLGQEDPLEKR